MAVESCRLKSAAVESSRLTSAAVESSRLKSPKAGHTSTKAGLTSTPDVEV